MLISGKMSVAMLRSANGKASTISIAITMNVYGRRNARATMDRGEASFNADEVMAFRQGVCDVQRGSSLVGLVPTYGIGMGDIT